MAVQTAVAVNEAPRSIEGLMELGSFVLKKLGQDLGMKDNQEVWSAFVGAPKEKMCTSLLERLKVLDASGGAPAPKAAPAAPVVAETPVDTSTPFDDPVPSTEGKKRKKEPQHSGEKAATAAPNSGTGQLIPNGPSGGDFMILSEKVEDLTRAVKAVGANTSTLVTNSPTVKDLKMVSDQVSALAQTLAEVQKTQVGLARLMLAIAEAVNIEPDDVVATMSDVNKGLKEVLGGGKA